jgi:predicted nucleic acid-binding protein
MKFIVDSNVLSELWKAQPDQRVVDWIDENDWFIPAPVVAELQEGASAATSPARRLQLNQKIDLMLSDYDEALLDWDAETARVWGRLKHSPEVKRKPQALWDSLIDALAVRHDAIVVTRNMDDFRHAQTFNPWKDSK